MKTKNVLEKNFKKYAEMFPNNQELAWMATRGGQGHAPSAGIKVFENSGHYILRNGWDKTSTPEYLIMKVVELLIIFAVGSVKQNLITQ